MGTIPASFNGSSTFSADLQQAITRAVTIASLPLNQLNSNVADLQNQGTELTTLQSDFAAIQTALQNLGQSTNGGSLAASVSDPSVATASLDTAAAIAGGTYTLNVISAGSPTTTISNAGTSVTDPSSASISSASSFSLAVGGSTFNISPAANTLSALVQAINAAGAGVTATLVNLGSPSAPDYRLSVQSTGLGNVSIQLNDGSQDLLSTSSTGSLAQYQIDGQPTTPISSDSSTITLAPGLTVNLLAAGQSTITVAPDPSNAASALSSFVTAYNAVATELNKNHGNSGGALTGQSIVFSLEQSLQNLSSFSGGTGSVQSLADLGITFNQTGQLSFDQSQFSTAVANNPGDVASFLGSATGGGFLGSATSILNGLEDTNTGLFQSAENTTQQQITADNQKISDTEAHVTTVQNQMTAQMAAADSLISSLQAQSSYFTSYFTAEQNVQNSITNG